MTDSPTTAPHDLRRWPSDPGQLADTTLCPACFAPLTSARCSRCDLDLAVPAASELLAIGRRIHDDEVARQRVISQMRTAQAARAQTLAAAPTIPAAASIEVVAPPVPRSRRPPRGRYRCSGPETEARADVPPPPSLVEGVPPAPARGGRSGVQVLLLTLGVVLISITAIVFLFVAYLVASLEVRSVIIAAASVLVLAVAWLLRARRLPGTAEGVASVAIVLLLLDVWIVRVNELFGTDELDAAAYAGGALLVVAAILAGTRAVSGIRVTGFAAAALIPPAVFLLVFSAAPAARVRHGRMGGHAGDVARRHRRVLPAAHPRAGDHRGRRVRGWHARARRSGVRDARTRLASRLDLPRGPDRMGGCVRRLAPALGVGRCRLVGGRRTGARRERGPHRFGRRVRRARTRRPPSGSRRSRRGSSHAPPRCGRVGPGASAPTASGCSPGRAPWRAPPRSPRSSSRRARSFAFSARACRRGSTRSFPSSTRHPKLLSRRSSPRS